MILLQDQFANKNNTKGKIVTFFFRLSSLAAKNHFYKIILIPYTLFYKFFLNGL